MVSSFGEKFWRYFGEMEKLLIFNILNHPHLLEPQAYAGQARQPGL
nr:MAG TPA: hypothetical protein [Caudoviricetes sp.]